MPLRADPPKCGASADQAVRGNRPLDAAAGPPEADPVVAADSIETVVDISGGVGTGVDIAAIEPVDAEKGVLTAKA